MESSDKWVSMAVIAIYFLGLPLHFIANNQGDLQTLRILHPVAAYSAAAVITAIIFMPVVLLLGRTRIAPAIAVWIRFIFFFVLLTGFALPLTSKAGQIETHDIPIDWLHLGLATLISIALVALCRTSLRRVLILAGLLFGAVTTAFAAATISTGVRSTGLANLLAVSSESNLFVVSFDGLPRDPTNEAIRESEVFRQVFRDFSLFSEVISTAPSTETSLASEVAGGVDLKRLYGTEENLRNTIDRASLTTNRMARSGINVSVYGAYSLLFDDHTHTVAPGSITPVSGFQRADQIGEIFEMATARVVTPRLVFGRSAARRLETWLAPASLLSNSRTSESLSNVKSHTGAEWDVPNITSVQDFYTYVSDLRIGTSSPAAHFIHFLHTHMPVDFDRYCSYRSNDSAWFNAHQNREGVKDEARCALSQLALFLDKLRTLGIYDSSTIVLKSDHGTPVAYNDAGRIESFTVRGHPLWGYARYTPWLAIKGAGVSRMAPMVDSRHVALSDLAKTLCNVTTPERCGDVVGFDLLTPAAIPDGATYFVNLVRDENSTFRMDETQESVALPRNQPFFEALTDLLSAEILVDLVPCNEDIDLLAGAPFNNGFSDYASWATWRDAGVLFIKWRGGGCPPGSRLELTLRLPSGQSSRALRNVEFDGKQLSKVGIDARQSQMVIKIPISDNAGYHLLAIGGDAGGTGEPTILHLRTAPPDPRRGD